MYNKSVTLTLLAFVAASKAAPLADRKSFSLQPRSVEQVFTKSCTQWEEGGSVSKVCRVEGNAGQRRYIKGMFPEDVAFQSFTPEDADMEDAPDSVEEDEDDDESPVSNPLFNVPDESPIDLTTTINSTTTVVTASNECFTSSNNSTSPANSTNPTVCESQSQVPKASLSPSLPKDQNTSHPVGNSTTTVNSTIIGVPSTPANSSTTPVNSTSQQLHVNGSHTTQYWQQEEDIKHHADPADLNWFPVAFIKAIGFLR